MFVFFFTYNLLCVSVSTEGRTANNYVVECFLISEAVARYVAGLCIESG